MGTRNFKRAYVWSLPVRIYHWANALAVIVLATTGLLIAHPPAILTSSEASGSYWFGTIRFIHFVTAYIFFFSFLFRFYWGFVGNRYVRWSNFLPFSKKARKNLLHVLKVDVLLMNEKQPDINDISVGHNSLAAFSYLVLFLMSLVMIFTGFGLYSSTSEWWLPDLFNWVVPLLGGDFTTRMVHHIDMWLMILFVIIHVYLVLYHDWVEGRGEISAMISGYKYVCAERIEKEVEENADLEVEQEVS